MHRPARTRATLSLALATALLTACGGGSAAAPGTTTAGTAATNSSPSPATTTTPAATSAPTATTPGETSVQIRLTAGDTVLSATVADNPTAAAFLAQLPFTVQIEDHANTEKTFYPPAELTTEGSADGYTPTTGDVAYYSPWGNIAVYYQDFAYSAGLVPIARIDGDPAVLADLPDGTQLRVELG